ncbi:hypothetical protein GBAR_LOCUS16232 [Geodia barretti]|uniref:Uncharacterized protein n=1 Tax=Geodia barretti TaxID=519541 RepID=A0AA35SH07_GEOBA|nr:hypothetical protein GBAR_LOCUS16232 [Geodia barretti]
MVTTNPGMADDRERGTGGRGCDVTHKKKEELQDLNNEMDTFMMKVEEKFRSLQEELEEVAKKKEDYYEGRQRMEEEYKQSRERELLLTRQSRYDFEGWWECAKETLKETEVGIQKRMEEIPEVKRETCKSFIQNRTLLGKKVNNVAN